jgi:hypothetical protein
MSLLREDLLLTPPTSSHRFRLSGQEHASYMTKIQWDAVSKIDVRRSSVAMSANAVAARPDNSVAL